MAAPIRIDLDVEMRARDGTVLRADVIRPDAADRVPALVCRTPYDKTLRRSTYAHLRPLDAAAAGFAVVFQDVRGRFASEGEWTPMAWGEVEGPDGHDCVEWVAREPWCDGQVGLFGGSYEGLNALAAAQARPPSLRAIAPALLGSADGRRTTMMLEGIIVSWSALVAVDLLERRRRAGDVDGAGFAKAMAALGDPAGAARTLPLAALGPLTIPGMPSYAELCERLRRASDAIADGIARIEVPSFWTTGWWDQAGGSALFRRARAHAATEAARAGARLWIGPWSHTQFGPCLGELGFGALAAIESAMVSGAHLAFFARYLRGASGDSPRVRYFLTGRNVWRDAADWPPPAVRERRLHLDAGGRLADDAPTTEGADRYRHDPQDPVPSIGVRALNLGGATVPGPFDQSRVESRADVLVYTSAPLEAALEVAGDPVLHLFVSSSASDADFVAKLCDVDRQGVSRNVADGFVRLRWREPGGESFVAPGTVVEIAIDLGLVGHAFLPGHRVRVQVASSAFPHLDRNLGTTEPIGAGTEGVVAEQTIHRGRGRASFVALPVLA